MSDLIRDVCRIENKYLLMYCDFQGTEFGAVYSEFLDYLY